MNDVRAPPFVPQPLGDLVEVPVRRRLVLALGKMVDARAQQLGQQKVARGAIEDIVVRHAILQLDHGLPAQAPGRRRGEANEVRLQRPGDEDRVGALGRAQAKVVFQLAYLVAAHGQPVAIVTLGPEGDAEAPAEVFQPLQWRLALEEIDLGMGRQLRQRGFRSRVRL